MPQDPTDPLSLLEGRRKYAAFFELGGKWQKELTVGEELVRALNTEFGYRLEHLELHEPDPPDLACTEDGQRIALEVTELVCARAVKANEMGNRVYREWRPGEVSAALAALLRRKDSIRLQGGPFAALWLCIFTDEFTLTAEGVAEELAAVRFGPFHQITKAFLLFSYQPGNPTYPVVPLQLGA
jgi:hypothetical protein